jgi:hypothetical protein
MKRAALFHMRNYLTVIIAIFALSLFCSCTKSDNDQYSAAASNAAASIRFDLTNGANLETNGQLLSNIDRFTSAIKSDVSKELAVETAKAGQYLLQLHEEGHLPGILEDEHGQFACDIVPVIVSNKLVEITFPMVRTFRLVKNGESSTNNYILIKPTKNSEWILKKAWETDSNGQLVQEWPVQ